MSIAIENGIKHPGKKGGKPLKYPFDKMKVDQSFFVNNALIGKISPAARAYGQRHDKEFSCATEKKGVRVWRIK